MNWNTNIELCIHYLSQDAGFLMTTSRERFRGHCCSGKADENDPVCSSFFFFKSKCRDGHIQKRNGVGKHIIQICGGITFGITVRIVLATAF